MSYDNIKSNKKRGFILTLEKFSKKHRGGGRGEEVWGGQVDLPNLFKIKD